MIVGGREEKHPEGNYYIAYGGKWIPAGADALTAQQQRHALLSGNALKYELYSGRSVPKAVAVQSLESVAKGRKKSQGRNLQIPRRHGRLKAAGLSS